MKKILAKCVILSGICFGSSILNAQSAAPVPTVPGQGVQVNQTDTYHSSDTPAVGDPLGNGPMTPKHDAGPQITQKLNYDSTCQHEACQRAFKRWDGSTSWQQDRASGLSK